MKEADLRQNLVAAVLRLDALGMNRSSTGNVSARWGLGLLANHGLVAAGTTLAHAMKVAQEVESLCQLYLQPLAGGEPVLLSANDMASVLQKFRSYGRAARA